MPTPTSFLNKDTLHSYMTHVQDGIYEEDGLRVIATPKLLDLLKNDKSLQQAKAVKLLPGLVGPSLLMPDAHQGYGFAIGAVAAFDAKKGVIVPGGVGFDINCGIRVMTTSLSEKDIKPKLSAILDTCMNQIPLGQGGEHKDGLTHAQVDEILVQGMQWAKNKGYASEDDVQKTESQGCLEADPTQVSPTAKKRARFQVGTLGAGNHFIEFSAVEKIYDEKVATAYGVTQVGQVVVMVHSGSRGLGHQTCSEYLRLCEDAYPELLKTLPDADLLYMPMSSDLAKKYYSAMCACANFAWVNRFMMMHKVAEIIQTVFPKAKCQTMYDVAHNIAKKEIHTVDGKKQELIVHRKGATRAFPAKHVEICKAYKAFGHPACIPGSMGTHSFIVRGTQKALDLTWGSVAHGSGRVMSRHRAMQEIKPDVVLASLEKKGILLKSPHVSKIMDEAPQVYKDSYEVIEALTSSGIAEPIISLRPLGVIKA